MVYQNGQMEESRMWQDEGMVLLKLFLLKLFQLRFVVQWSRSLGDGNPITTIQPNVSKNVWGLGNAPCIGIGAWKMKLEWESKICLPAQVKSTISSVKLMIVAL